MRRLLLLMAAACGALLATAPAQASSAQAGPSQLEPALHSVIWADDGANVYDAARGQVVRFMGDTEMINGTSCPFLCTHDAVVVNRPGEASFTVIRYGGTYQAVPNWPDGSEYWFGGALATPGTIYDYGARVLVTAAAARRGAQAVARAIETRQQAAGITVMGDYVAAFSASTLALESLTQVTGPAQYLSLGSAVPWYGGHWMIGTSQPATCPYLTDCISGQAVWVPAGDEAVPSKWGFSSKIPASLSIGNVVSLFRWNGCWYAITKNFDEIGQYLEELRAGPYIRGATWTAVPGKHWATQGSISYSAQIDADPAPAGMLGATYAENDSAWYGLHFLDFTPGP